MTSNSCCTYFSVPGIPSTRRYGTISRFQKLQQGRFDRSCRMGKGSVRDATRHRKRLQRSKRSCSKWPDHFLFLRHEWAGAFLKNSSPGYTPVGKIPGSTWEKERAIPPVPNGSSGKTDTKKDYAFFLTRKSAPQIPSAITTGIQPAADFVGLGAGTVPVGSGLERVSVAGTLMMVPPVTLATVE